MVPWNVTGLRVLPGRRLEVAFADGLCGIVDLSREKLDGVLAPLADDSVFTLARIENGAVTWPNGIEFAPDAMYDEVLAMQRAPA